MHITLFVLSLFGGLLSGMLGVGGAVVMIPLMLTVPGWVGVGTLEMRAVAGISMLQVLASALSGLVIHRNNGQVDGTALRWIGFPMALASLAGATATRYVENEGILAVFTAVVLAAFVLLLRAKHSPAAEHPGATKARILNHRLAVLIGTGVGAASGMVGAGGGFILVPLMIVVLRIPLKVTVGTSLGIVFLGALTGAVGKVASAQVPWGYLLPVLAGSIPAARLGAHLSHRMPSSTLRAFLLVLVFLSFVQSFWKLVSG